MASSFSSMKWSLQECLTLIIIEISAVFNEGARCRTQFFVALTARDRRVQLFLDPDTDPVNYTFSDPDPVD
jgi:hypothetical protein